MIMARTDFFSFHWTGCLYNLLTINRIILPTYLSRFVRQEFHNSILDIDYRNAEFYGQYYLRFTIYVLMMMNSYLMEQTINNTCSYICKMQDVSN